MFGQNKVLRRRHSQALSVRRRGVCFLFFLGLSLLIKTDAQAQAPVPQNATQNKQTMQQTPPPSTNLQPPEFVYKPPHEKAMFDFSDFAKNIHGNYSVSLMGPTLNGNSNETYNIYYQDTAPIQLFHSWSISYHASPSLKVGASISAPQNLTSTVGDTGILYNPSFIFFDPMINFDFPRLFDVDGWMIYTTASFSLPVTTESEDIGKITALTFTQGWTAKTYPSPWSYGFDLFFKPQFYSDPMPAAFAYRQSMVFAFGHHLSYRVSPLLSLGNSTNFDYEHRSTPTGPATDIGTNLPDTIRFSFSVTPNVAPGFLSMGGYMQALIWNVAPETTIVGADFSVGF